MNDVNILRLILHVSDFHLTDNKKQINYAKNALKSLADKLKSENIKVDYLIHTGDIIDSSDLYIKAAKALSLDKEYIKKEQKNGKKIDVFDSKKFVEKASEEQLKQFDIKVNNLAEIRFEKAEEVMKEFISNLNISFGSVIICSGNHDVLRKLSNPNDLVTCTKYKESWRYSCPENFKSSFQPFEDFLNKLGVANSQKRCNLNEPVSYCSLDNLNYLILNTNWKNPKEQKPGYYCVNCEKVKETIKKINPQDGVNRMNIVLAHKPIYEICEKARLSYKRYINTSFMSSLQKYVGENGIYFCGDKHTRSIIGSHIHDISHYISGEPLSIPSPKSIEAEVEYNLLEISKCKLGMERKIHLRYSDKNEWICEIRPQDAVVSKLYKLSKAHITRNSFEAIDGTKTFQTWESLCQELYNWTPEELDSWYNNLNNLYLSICKYRKNGFDDISLKEENIFTFVLERLKEQMSTSTSENLLNIRGENSSGKSTFLGLLYIFLLYEYSIGKIDFIPAYFNLESKELYDRIKNSGSYYDAVQEVFGDFSKKVQNIADKEHHSVCYIIDGLDEQDCWSYVTEDSVGRCLLNILAKYENSRYVMSFSQQRLPSFKNTMPSRKYNDKSDIMYFNPIDVQAFGAEDKRFVSFVESFLKLKRFSLHVSDNVCTKKTTVNSINLPLEINEKSIEDICSIIRKFRRLTINPGFMYQNYNYIISPDQNTGALKNVSASVEDVYGYYIDRQYEICLNKLGYGFVNYAPVMAYLFAYQGYTYEKFKHLNEYMSSDSMHMHKPICDNHDKVYNTFLFIKKHKDAREYLIALHYNRELRYFAEHPNETIGEESILNQFVSRNVCVMIRKLWSDTNKFIIVCEQLLKRSEIKCCTLSILIYCLAHLQIYSPFQDKLYSKMRYKAKEIFQNQYIDGGDSKSPSDIDLDDTVWRIQGCDNAEKLDCFVDLGLIRSIKIFEKMDKKDSVELVKKILSEYAIQKEKNSTFIIYNRQFQMLYYGDLSIQGEDKKRPLNPGTDKVYKGFDFHNCFNYLYFKLNSNENYPLKEFDMFTLCDLIYSRLSVEYLEESNFKEERPNTFFYRDAFEEKSTLVLEQAKDILKKHLSKMEDKNNPVYKYFEIMAKKFEELLIERENGRAKKIKQIMQELNNELEEQINTDR